MESNEGEWNIFLPFKNTPNDAAFMEKICYFIL